MLIDWEVAAKVLNESDLKRLACVLLSCDTTTLFSIIDWQKATIDYKSASVESMKISTRNVIKKMKKAAGIEGAAETAAKPAGKKRKGAAEDVDDAETKPKKRGKRAKSETSPVKGGDDVEENIHVKSEEEEL